MLYPLRKPASLLAAATLALVFGSSAMADTNGHPVDARSAPANAPGHPESVLTGTMPTVWTENFESGTVPPSGWTVESQNAGFTWGTYDIDPPEGSWGADVEYDPDLVPQDEWLLSPSFQISEGELSVWNMGSIYWCRDDFDNCDLEVWLVFGATPDTGTDTLVATLDSEWPASFSWVQSIIDLTPHLTGAEARIGFRYVGVDGAQAAVDDIVLTGSQTMFDVGGTITGLQGGSITLQLNGANNLVVNADGSFTFGTQLSQGDSYNVTIAQQPPGQFCTIANGSGTVGSAPIADIEIICQGVSAESVPTIGPIAMITLVLAFMAIAVVRLRSA